VTKVSNTNLIEFTPGVMPSTDATSFDTPCWVEAYHVRFDPETGRVRKIGGWSENQFDYGNTIQGTMRTIYSDTINQKVYTVIGTNSYLYSLIGSNLVNISPLVTVGVAAANSLATHYDTLANDPITTVDDSNSVTVADSEAALFQLGDTYTLSGATTTNGIPDTELNSDHIVRGIGIGTVTIIVASSATSSGSGGGAAVVRSSGLLTLNDAAHGLLDGYRVGIADATTTGGITNGEINNEFIIRNVQTDSFDFMTTGTATSSVSAGGGASTEYFPQIDAGNINQGLGQGYGAGLYGVGLYGTALTSLLGETYPRIWFVDRFGNNLVMTAGNQSEAYVWTGSNAIAPTVIAGAPDDINYLFVSDNILVTFGHDVENKIFASDQGDYTNWVASSTNQVFEDIIEGAGRFTSHVPVDGYNLIFTEQQTWTMKYIGGTAVWQILPLDKAIGLIAPMARCQVNGVAYWMGQDNFYMFRGGKVETIPSNLPGVLQSTMVRYVFDDLNYSQRSKFFTWYNEKFDEIWFHYASSTSNECDRIARYSRKLSAWVTDTMDRTAGEYPVTSLSNPRLGNVGTLYTHEAGANDNGSAMQWYVRSNKFTSGKNTADIVGIIPDSNQSGTVTATIQTFNYPQSANPVFTKVVSIIPTTERIPIMANGRMWQYYIEGNELNQTFLMGRWAEEVQGGATAP
jgi:hypothetical protein